jgi:hypothetical protein
MGSLATPMEFLRPTGPFSALHDIVFLVDRMTASCSKAACQNSPAENA